MVKENLPSCEMYREILKWREWQKSGGGHDPGQHYKSQKAVKKGAETDSWQIKEQKRKK